MGLCNHYGISVPRQVDPRANQKERTRTAVIEAALGMLREDQPVTVALAAEKAMVSRTTAYRYFPTQDDLLRAISEVHPAVAEVDRVISSLDTDDVEERLLEVLDTLNPIVIADEAHMRTALGVFVDDSLAARFDGQQQAPYARSRRRMRWLDEVLEPLQDVTDERRDQLRAALTLTLGIEAIVVMKDVCGLDDAEAVEVLRWAATALLRAGVDGT